MGLRRASTAVLPVRLALPCVLARRGGLPPEPNHHTSQHAYVHTCPHSTTTDNSLTFTDYHISQTPESRGAVACLLAMAPPTTKNFCLSTNGNQPNVAQLVHICQ